MDPLSEEAEYDPAEQCDLVGVHGGNEPVHAEGAEVWDQTDVYARAYGDPDFTWDLQHQPPGGPPADQQGGGTNVMPDLAFTMKSNPKMKVMLAGGYYDLATPYFEGKFEMHHLPIPEKLQANISYHYYQSGHMVYVNEDVLKQFHADVAAFIRGTESGK